MTQPPSDYETKVVPAEKLEELFNGDAFQQKLAACREERKTQPQAPWLDSQRKKEIIQYFDSENAEVALMALYTDHPPSTLVQRIILRICIDRITYDLRLI